MADKPEPRKEIDKLGYKIIYKPHREEAEHMAFYRVEYNGEEVKCSCADKFNMPLNEIWISKKLKPFEKYVLHHELKEIEHRAKGMDDEKSHKEALKDEEIWSDEEKWQKMKREINLITERSLTDIDGLGHRLFESIRRNRPYFNMEELKEVPYIGEERYRRLKNRLWCM